MLQYTIKDGDHGVYTSDDAIAFYKSLKDSKMRVTIAIPTDPNFTLEPSTISRIRGITRSCADPVIKRDHGQCLETVSTI